MARSVGSRSIEAWMTRDEKGSQRVLGATTQRDRERRRRWTRKKGKKERKWTRDADRDEMRQAGAAMGGGDVGKGKRTDGLLDETVRCEWCKALMQRSAMQCNAVQGGDDGERQRRLS